MGPEASLTILMKVMNKAGKSGANIAQLMLNVRYLYVLACAAFYLPSF